MGPVGHSGGHGAEGSAGGDGALWIFGYGSLVWRPDFRAAERAPAWTPGFVRRFWQGSPDHRGAPEAPGRVVTLVPAPAARCWGVAYRVREADRSGVLRALDHRESGGFERLSLPLHFADPGRPPVRGTAWVATDANPNYLGPAPVCAVARQVRGARGGSGANAEYVLHLADSLRALGAEDPEVSLLAALVRT